MKPMLAVKISHPKYIAFPVMCTPKIDGIRCVTLVRGAPKSRTLKDIPNEHIRDSILEYGVEGLDGEIWIPGAETFGDVSSKVMKKKGTPVFEYIVFDVWNDPGESYCNRAASLSNLPKPTPPWLKILQPVTVIDEEGFITYWNDCVDKGYEGVIAREAGGIYKYGRSTLGEGLLMKYKNFEDAEAEIIGFEEQMTNTNPKVKNNLGESQRSSAKAGKKPAGKLGKFKCRDLSSGIEFEVGTGYSDKQRVDFWRNKQVYVGMVLKYRYQPHGVKLKPRFPSFIGFRHRDDM
jgi:DNA ligase-1